MDVFGSDYPTPDGTCVRDYIHVTDLAAAHSAALSYLRAGGKSDVFNCGYTRGFSVLEVIEAVNKVAGLKIDARIAPRRAGDPAAIVEKRGMKQVTDTGAIEKAVDEIIAANPEKVAQAKAKPSMLGWFVGQVMKATGGKANPAAVNEILKAKLGI